MSDDVHSDLDLNDNSAWPKMTRWFSPMVLIISLKKKIISEIFGWYSDARLISAALDKKGNVPVDLRNELRGQEDIWFDFVADTGDGFESTYAVAYSLAQDSIVVDGKKLPRGDFLIMGGDEVYPTPSRINYKHRLENPYSVAFPYRKLSVKPPLVFLVPGNHDWYDGLRLFLAKFCKGKQSNESDNKFGKSNWRTSQSRSYFALQLPNNWWIWGIDVQLGNDIDTPQHKYFLEIAKNAKNAIKDPKVESKVILCVASPTWLQAASEDIEEIEFYKRGIDHVASKIIEKEWGNARIFSVLTGDLHHYNRYTGVKSNTHFITAGGGGAYMFPTHHLPSEIKNIHWHGQENETLNKEKNDSSGSCFPDEKLSMKLCWGNLFFLKNNAEFCLIIGLTYAASFILLRYIDFKFDNLSFFDMSSILYLFDTVVCSGMFYFLLAIYWAILSLYADYTRREWVRKLTFGLIHGLVHVVSIFFLFVIFNAFSASMLSNNFESTLECIICDYFTRFLMFILIVILGGMLGGTVWGIYLTMMTRFFKKHISDGFSALRIKDYKNFLRICIKRDELIIYPIGIPEVPGKDAWRENANENSVSQLSPENPIKYKIIEGPIHIPEKKQ